jgi:hypothetical protein
VQCKNGNCNLGDLLYFLAATVKCSMSARRR